MTELNKISTRGGHLTIGQLIELLDGHDPDMSVSPHGGPSGFDGICSYRGSYDCLAICPGDYLTTVGELRDMLNDVIGKTLRGYKGREYEMHNDTPVYIADYGMDSRLMVVGVSMTSQGNNLCIRTEWEDY